MTNSTINLNQKHPIKGSRDFELSDDEIHYTVQTPFSSESLTVVLSILDPEPVISGSTLSFISEVNKEPLVEFFVDKPDKESFEQFISVMRSRVINEDFSRFHARDRMIEVDTDRLDETLSMLQSYVETAEIESLMTALMNLRADPESLKNVNDVAKAFNELGFVKGQVVTYAPYISHLLATNQNPADLLDG